MMQNCEPGRRMGASSVASQTRSMPSLPAHNRSCSAGEEHQQPTWNSPAVSGHNQDDKGRSSRRRHPCEHLHICTSAGCNPVCACTSLTIWPWKGGDPYH